MTSLNEEQIQKATVRFVLENTQSEGSSEVKDDDSSMSLITESVEINSISSTDWVLISRKSEASPYPRMKDLEDEQSPSEKRESEKLSLAPSSTKHRSPIL